MLLKPAYQIQTADSGRAALDQIAAFRPDIVIMDIKMPEMDGLEVLRRIKRARPVHRGRDDHGLRLAGDGQAWRSPTAPSST